jgi:flagellar basal-body rod protein FlgB
MAGLLQDATLEAMGNYMTRLARRHEVVSSNIANVDTPGYKTRDISFHATLEELMSGASPGWQTTRPEHLESWTFASPEPQVFEVQGLPARVDQNNVQIDQEMLKLGETAFGYSMMALLLRSKFRTIGSSINEGRIG